MTPKQIRITRQKLKLTQEDFARVVGVRPETVHRWEAGKFRPHPVFQQKLQELARNGGHSPKVA